MEFKVGCVKHYFNKIGVAVVEIINGTLRLNDTVRIEGLRTDFIQTITSMQIDYKNIEEAKVGDIIALKVEERVREGDKVYKIYE